jgi:hypothetical protein
MRGLSLALLAMSAIAFLPARAWADDDDGLGRIPGEALKDEPPRKETPDETKGRKGREALERRLFLEDAFTVSPFRRAVPVPYPKDLVFDYQNRTSFDGTLTWTPLKPLRFVLSDRLSVIEEDDVSFLSSQTVENALREVFVSAQIGESTFLEAGRLNVRNGVALGFNPTDFMKTRTLVGQASLDPSVLRENRLGTLMVRVESIFGFGAASLAFAPKVTSPPPLSERHPLRIDPRFGATNGMNRALATLSLHVLDLSPELLGYLEPDRRKLGLDISHPVGSAIVAYAEWAGGSEANLATRAHAFGVATGTLPPNAPVLPPTTTTSAFRSDVATGFSLTVATAATLNFEYHFHEGGLGRSDFRRWVSAGSAPGAPSSIPDELWFVRGYASDQEEPLARHQLFVRADFPKTLRHDIDLGAFAFVNLEDGSSLSQLSFSYYLSDSWTVSGFLSANLGSRHSERGSHPESVSTILALRLYL